MDATAGSTAISRAGAREEQLELLKTAERACWNAEREAKSANSPSSAAAGAAEPNTLLVKELEAVASNFAGLHKLMENQEVSSHHAF